MSERTPWYRHRKRRTIGCWLAVVLAFVLGWLVGVPLAVNWRYARMGHDLCLSQQNLLASTLYVYAADHDDRLPPYDRWASAAAGPGRAVHYGCSTLRHRYYWEYESAEDATGAVVPELDYDFAKSLAEARYPDIPRPGETLMLWDMDPVTHEPAFRHRKRINVAYVDGHCEGGLGRARFEAELAAGASLGESDG